MAAIPRFIATFLELPNVDEFSGHAFRRTSATLISEKGMGLLELKQHGRWKSTAVCERYVDNTVVKKNEKPATFCRTSTKDRLHQNDGNCHLHELFIRNIVV